MAREKNGWIKLYSSVLEKDFSPVEFKIWVGLLLIANSAKSKTPGLIDLSLREIANRLNVSTGALVQTKEKFIAQGRIKETKVPRRTKPISALEIINFSQYQGKEFVSRNEQSKEEIVSPSEQKVHSIEQSVSQNEQSRIQKRHQRITENNREYIYSLFNLWNEQKIIVHKKLTDDMKRAIDSALRDCSLEEVSQAIKNYAEILKGDQYRWTYSWTLKDFLKRGLEKFLDLEVARSNYRRDKDKAPARQVKYEDV